MDGPTAPRQVRCRTDDSGWVFPVSTPRLPVPQTKHTAQSIYDSSDGVPFGQRSCWSLPLPRYSRRHSLKSRYLRHRGSARGVCRTRGVCPTVLSPTNDGTAYIPRRPRRPGSTTSSLHNTRLSESGHRLRVGSRWVVDTVGSSGGSWDVLCKE